MRGRTPPTQELEQALRAAQVWDLVAVAARRARHRGRGPRLPAQRGRAAAARDRPAAAQGAAHHRPRRGDRPPRQRVRGVGAAGARHRARGAHLDGDRPPPVDRAQRRPDLRGRRRAGSSSAEPTPSCSPAAASTAELYDTQFAAERATPRPIPSLPCPDLVRTAQWRAWISHSRTVSTSSPAPAAASAGPPLRSLVAEGAKVVVSSRDRDSVDACVAALGGPSRPTGSRRTTPTPVRRMRSSRRRATAFGRLDGALISVGGPTAGPAMERTDEEWVAAFEAVFLGAVRLRHRARDASSGAADRSCSCCRPR